MLVGPRTMEKTSFAHAVDRKEDMFYSDGFDVFPTVYSESGIQYDRNGNIKRLVRTGYTSAGTAGERPHAVPQLYGEQTGGHPRQCGQQRVVQRRLPFRRICNPAAVKRGFVIPSLLRAS